jgi:hypothetical protein
MKNLHQTEKHLADKLQNVPVPDVDQGWEQMRKLLDNEMPEPVAGAWSGNRKWWWMGITAGIIMLATWLSQQLNEEAALANNQQAANTAPAANINVNNQNKNTVTVKNNNSTLKTKEEKNTTEQNGHAEKNVTEKETTSPVSTVDVVDKNETKPVDNLVMPDENKAENKTDNSKLTGRKNDAVKFNQTTVVKKPLGTGSLSPRKQIASILNGGKTTPASNNPAPDNKIAAGNEVAAGNKAVSVKNNDDNNQTSIKTLGADESKVVDQPLQANSISQSRNGNDIQPSVTNIALNTAADVSGPSVQFNEVTNLQPEQLAVPGKTDRVFAREMRKKSMKADNRRMSRSSMRGGLGGAEKELTFAAGLALPQSFAVSNQQASRYNVNGGSSRITDYLPAPFFQYHINSKLFVQTEFHFQSPQYTQRLLLSRNVDSFFSRRFESNVRLEKLYYFNIPFNVYYSPARNFYVGGGLQYSSLLSGVASYENRTVDGQTLINSSSVTRRFKDDSAAAAFAPSEWRYQFDANYNFSRFSFGLRYNRAMRDFINVSGTNNIPAARDRNRSFLLYLRFNIWEERKKID